MSGPSRILVIKHSALGDFVQAMGPFAAIRQHHPGARITLLTTKPMVDLARASLYFDEIWVDHRPKAWEVRELLRLRKMLRSVKFQMVYDLQTSDRSSSYYFIMGEPSWSGIAMGCSHPHDNPGRDLMHTLDRQAEQLKIAGIPKTPPPDLGWAVNDVRRFRLPQRFLLLAPGGALHRSGKRWPAAHYAALAQQAGREGIASVVIGTKSDSEAIDAILAVCPTVMSLADHTTLLDLPAIARQALAAVGNDTGPMHLAAAVNCPSVVLFSSESDPALCAPRGRVTVLRQDDLASLDPATVWEAVVPYIGV